MVTAINNAIVINKKLVLNLFNQYRNFTFLFTFYISFYNFTLYDSIT